MTVEQAAGTREPASRLRNFSVEQRGKAKPKCASHRWFGVSLAQERLMGASQKVRSFHFPSDQESSLRELRKILRIERHFLIGRHKLRKGSSPRLSAKGIATLLQGARSRIRVLRSRPILHSCKSVYLNSVCVAPAANGHRIVKSIDKEDDYKAGELNGSLLKIPLNSFRKPLGLN
jgi:hypothetical protein